MDEIAPQVYSPMPGSRRSRTGSGGSAPPYSRTMTAAAFFRLRAALPELHAEVVVDGGEGFDGRAGFEKAAVVRDDGLDARLLEHDLGQPDAVGVPGPAPRERTGVFPVPRGDEGDEGGGKG